jgi:hypothetical protein
MEREKWCLLQTDVVVTVCGRVDLAVCKSIVTVTVSVTAVMQTTTMTMWYVLHSSNERS